MIRIVKLTFKNQHVPDFLAHFETVKEKINNFPGCHGMKLLQDESNEHIFFTYSEWKDSSALEKYRKSDLFGSIWPKVKNWFSEDAAAWSLDEKFNGFK